MDRFIESASERNAFKKVLTPGFYEIFEKWYPGKILGHKIQFHFNEEPDLFYW